MNGSAALAALAIYVTVVVTLGIVATRRSSKGPDEYFLAGRKLGPLVLFMALFGTNSTSFVLLAIPAMAYTHGIGVFGLNAPIVAYMISDEGDWVTGQVFATGMERLGVMIQPQYGSTLMREGGWDVESVRRWFKDGVGKQLQPFGLGKFPYPYSDGVKPRL